MNDTAALALLEAMLDIPSVSGDEGRLAAFLVQAMVRALKPAGRIVFVEFRAEDPDVPIKPVHKMTQAQVRKEMAVHPLAWVETIETLPRQHIIVFRRKD